MLITYHWDICIDFDFSLKVKYPNASGAPEHSSGMLVKPKTLIFEGHKQLN